MIQEPYLSVLTLSDFQRSNLHCLRLSNPYGLFPSAAKRVQPGVWISRGVIIHPSATIVPSVFLSEYSQVGDGAQIGPEVIVEGRCVIDKGTSIKKSIICRESYVGESLEIRNSIIDHNTLVNLSHKSHVQVADEFILGHLKSPLHHIHLSSLFMRGAAFMGIVALSPLFVFLVARYGLSSQEVLQLPASPHKKSGRPSFYYV